MTWLAVIGAVLNVLGALTRTLEQRKLLQAGEASHAKATLENALDRIRLAQIARRRAGAVPAGRLRDDDGFRRD